MKIIKIDTELKLTIHESPTGSYSQQKQVLQELIGNHCRICERVLPERLYTELGIACFTTIPGQHVCMLVDGEGGLKEGKQNLVGSYLYKTDQHGCPIMGNILFVGEEWDDGNELHFCGIESSVFKTLESELHNMVSAMKERRKVFLRGPDHERSVFIR